MPTSTAPDPRLARLARKLGGIENGQLHVGGVPIHAMARTVPTPFYVYGADAVAGTVGEVREALGPDVHLYYSLKANPSLGLCQVLARHNLGAELASSGELVLALRAGFPPQRILFAGPGKTEHELEMALRFGIAALHVESRGELRRLAALAQRAGTRAPVALRINPRAPLKGAQMRMGGGPAAFGIDEEDIDALLEELGNHPWLEILGVHVYAGSQLVDVDALAAQVDAVIDIARHVAERLDRPLRSVDFGGGFGVPYFADSRSFDLAAFGRAFAERVARCRASPALGTARLIVELGRYLVAEAGVYVTRVVDVKRSRGKTYVVTDGGMNHHITATGNFGQIFRKAYPIAPVERMNAEPEHLATVVGPCCTPLDTFGEVRLPEVSPGDLIGVFSSGAYGYSASSLSFLSHPTPAELLVCGGRVHVLRQPGTPEQVLAGQNPVCGV